MMRAERSMLMSLINSAVWRGLCISVNVEIDFLFGLIDSFSGQILQFQLDDARSGVLPLSG